MITPTMREQLLWYSGNYLEAIFAYKNRSGASTLETLWAFGPSHHYGKHADAINQLLADYHREVSS